MARTYLVVIDDSPEAQVALPRAGPPKPAAKSIFSQWSSRSFVQWGGVQAAIDSASGSKASSLPRSVKS